MKRNQLDFKLAFQFLAEICIGKYGKRNDTWYLLNQAEFNSGSGYYCDLFPLFAI